MYLCLEALHVFGVELCLLDDLDRPLGVVALVLRQPDLRGKEGEEMGREVRGR